MKTHSNDGSLVLNLPDETMKRLKARAAAANRPEAELVQEVILAFLDDNEWVESVEEGFRELDAGQGVDGDAVHSKWRARIAASRAERAR